ncbi:protocatechuate 3,4-dioxygenase subunit alpha [Polaromonas jejuensis]|uniref:Protocatechuate 3,4-dioxygenase subunit alpha n=1 Tax=Polaromonas jejuensis TaxID=457502 RepID=A0ABW0Q8B5_9BURK|nr:protocatechuate 3,4-dioxygenase subunit alpha [Polaromonas jejuensis]
MSQLKQTPSQTVGPYFAYGLAPSQYGYDLKSLFTPVLAQPHAAGEHIRITGQVFDGAGNPVNDALVEISQPDANGQPVASVADAEARGFAGFGRCGTGTLAQNHYVFDTVKPGVAEGFENKGQAPFINVCVTMRGLLVHTFTRIYFDDEAAANSQDAVLASVPAERRATLIAKRQMTGAGPVYRFDIHMQDSARGKETVFFDL